ncbi:MAG: DUF445 family protein [Desulfobulbaceae bacterium]|nr:DUF445 family protein [Desulfobulbaceae bacterium]
MNNLLQFAAPPVLGAFIGYMTNYVAIKMLFRPLRPWKIMGIRVPMTPGVIPSKRNMLARNIGEMVGEHLLTSGDVSKAINGKGFQGELRELINNRVDVLLQKDLGPINTIIPKRFKAYFRASIRILRLRFINHMHDYLESEHFAGTIDKAVSSQFENLLSQDLQTLFPEKNQEYFFAFLEKSIQNFLSGPEVKRWISLQLQTKMDSVLAENRSLGDIIPTELADLILDRLEEEAPALIDKFAGLLEQPATQEKITTAICNAISSFTSSLGPLASMMSSFISADTIRNKVSDYLDEKGAEIGKWLSDESVQKEVAKLLREKAQDFLKKPLSSLVKDISPDKINKLNEDFSIKVSDLLAKPATVQSITSLIRTALASQTERPVSDIIATLFGPATTANGQKWTSAEIVAIFRSDNVKQLLNDLVVEMIEKKLLAKPIGPPAALLPKTVQESFADYVLQQVSDILVREVPGLVTSLNIKQIVKRKVDSLDLLRLEGLLMSIMQEQFKYINLFGALLGFIIGLLNLLVLQL